MSSPEFERILGVRFFNGSALEAIEYLEQRGGYVVVPAAPALANIQNDSDYRRALLEADLAIADSGFMVLLWRFLRRRNIERISGLKYLQTLFEERRAALRQGTVFVLPSIEARSKALDWLNVRGIPLDADAMYVAPRYGDAVEDQTLVKLLESARPGNVVIAIGGGTQEKLGFFLREHLSFRPSIHCVGAALGFLTGDQKPIPAWADHFYLGWFLRLARAPRRYARRFSRAFALPAMILRYGENPPPLSH
jgi:UDP-N-acetyl-D-mannosaminuronic acid transferase (WecB/TagA/CpsF family)